MSLIVAETRKLTTVWTTAILTLVGVAVAGTGGAFFVFESEFSGEFLGQDAQIAAVIDQVGGIAIVPMIVGLLSVTTEFRHETIGRTFQLVPSRTRVVATKMVVGAVYGVLFFVLGALPLFGVMLLSGEQLAFGELTREALWQGPVGLILMTVFGVALGALLRSQVVAVSLSLVHFFIVESLFVQFLPQVGQWLPFQALNALFTSQETTAMAGDMAPTVLDPLVGLLVFVGYTLVAATGAVVLMRTRDV